MTALQTTQTIYKLFDWKSGTYAFEPREVTFDRETVSPLRCESVLMEGYRIIDEWPLVRKKIPSAAMTFERLKELAPPPAQAEGRGTRDGESAALGRNEWRVYELALPGVTVDRIADRSRLGEFEASKALFNLVNLGVLRAVPPAHRSAAAEVGAYARSWKERVRRGAAGVLATVAIAVALAALVLVVTGGGAYGTSAPASRRRQPGRALPLPLPAGAAPGGPGGVPGREGRLPGHPGGARRDGAGAAARPPLPLVPGLRLPAPGGRLPPRAARGMRGAPAPGGRLSQEPESSSSVRGRVSRHRQAADALRRPPGESEDRGAPHRRAARIPGEPDRHRRRRRGGADAGRAGGAGTLRPRRRTATRSTSRTWTRPPSWWRRGSRRARCSATPSTSPPATASSRPRTWDSAATSRPSASTTSSSGSVRPGPARPTWPWPWPWPTWWNGG